jgi:pyridoxamine 5'-phosphate oxidase
VDRVGQCSEAAGREGLRDLALSLADLRRDYARARLDETSVASDPLVEFARWFEEAVKAEARDVNAMTLATASADGTPSARIVLLKGFDERGFVFFTDYRSRKGTELAANPRAALVFYWPELERQVRITGTTSETGRQESEAYFRTRPRGSRISAWISHQSQVIGSRQELEAQIPEIERRYPGDDIPLPPYWGGFRLRPEVIEFWQGRTNRLHDRIRYVREGERWRIERLAP